MANSVSHGSLPYPIKNARYSILVPYLDADGDPTDPTTPDTELSGDAGAFADCAEEVTTITGSNGMGYITLTGAETNYSIVAVCAKVASGPKATLATLYPRNLPILESGTASAGAAGTITLASGTYTSLNLTGCFIRTTGGTGGGGTGGANNQARRIASYNTGTRVATVSPNWETTPDNTTTYDILLPEGVLVPMLTALSPTTLGRTLTVDSNGLADATTVKLGPSGSATAQTARDIGASVNQTGDSYAIVNNGTYGNAAIRTRGDSAWATATGFSTHSAADVWSVATRTLTAGTNIQLPANGLANVTAWTVDITGSLSGSVGSVAGAVGSVTGNVGGNVSGNVVGSVGSLATQAKADVNAEVDTALSDAGVTSARMGYLNNLNIGGNVASSAEATAIQNNTRAVRVVPDVIERPDSGTTTYRIELFLYDDAGNMEAPDSAPTIALVNQSGTDLSARLDSTTMTLVSTGRYRAVYTASVSDTLEQLVWAFSVVEGGVTRIYGNQSVIVDTTAVDFTASDRTKLDTLAADYTTARAAKIDNLDGAISGRASQASVDLIKAKTDNLPASPAATGDIPSAATVASAVRTELATELARIDAAISTRQISIWSSASATVNLSGTTVKAVTDAVNADVTKIDGNTSAAQLLSLSARTMYSGTVTGSPTTTSFVDSGTSSYGETDQFKGRIIIFYNAEHIVKEATNITAFDPDTNAFTFAALSRAPTIGDAFIVV